MCKREKKDVCQRGRQEAKEASRKQTGDISGNYFLKFLKISL